MQKIFNLTNLTLIVALSLSTVAAYYSIIGLTAIFAGAVIPIIVMGSILEVGKITTTVWLRKYWARCSWVLKLYLVPAVVALALLTSMGIFGFLSKAHMDSGIVSGDVQAKLALYDEKIKTQRDNIEVARKALQQMDAQVDARLSRGDSESGAERAVQIRRQQAGERSKLQKEIGDAQKEIAKLNEERAPIAAENRKVEAEVGPIKYIAALIYGDNTDANMLEAAVRWVIILLVIVFDPLAIALVLAANASKEWDKEELDSKETTELIPPQEEPITEPEPTQWTDSDPEIPEEPIKDPIEQIVEEVKPHNPNTHPYLNQGFKYPVDHQFEKPLVATIEKNEPEVTVEPEKVPEVVNEEPIKEPIKEPVEESVTVETPKEVIPVEIKTDGVTKENPITNLSDDYVSFEGKQIRREALKEMRPDLFKITADATATVSTNFGTTFPKISNKGDLFVRVDVLPNRVFKFDGKRWIEVNKEMSQTYLQNDDYLKFLISKIDNGEYDIEQLSEKEKEQIESFLNASK